MNEELKKELDLLKKALEDSVDEKAKAEITKQIKAIEDKFNDAIKEVPQLKSDLALTKATAEKADKEITELKAAQVTKDEADKKNQDALDGLIAEKKNRERSPEFKGKPLINVIEDALNEGDNFKNLEMLATNHKDRLKRFTIELKDAADITTANVTGGTRYGQIMAPGIIEPPKRKVHVRSLVPIGSAGPGNTYTFMRDNGGEGDPAPVAETAQKPQFDFDLIEKTVNFEWIAGWVRVTRKSMNNIPGFLSYLNSRLPEKLLRAEDAQLLTGDGTSPNISGILDGGNFTAAADTSDIFIERLIDALAQLEDEEERDATGILIRPVDYYGFFKNKAEDSGVYDLPKNVSFVNGVLYISGVPVFASTAMPSGEYIVGDWRMGAQLLIQNAMRIEFFEQDGINVRENKITVRIEESVAFPIYGDNYFIAGDVPNESA